MCGSPRVITIPQEGFEVFRLDVNLVVSYGVVEVPVQTMFGGQAKTRACFVTTTAGQKIFFDEKMFKEIDTMKTKTDLNDLDVPASILNSWKDPKEDLDKSD